MHKSRMRRAAPVALIAAAALVLAGCSPSSGPATQDGKTVVTFWQQKFEDYQQAWFKEQVAAYNDSQDDVVVKLEVVPADTWDQKLKAAQAAGKAPDIATTSYGRIMPGVAIGQFAQLDELIDPAALDDIQPNVREFVTTDEGTFAYPFLVEPSTVLFYRTDLFQAAGLDPANPPKSWDELIAAARALTTDGVYGMNIAQTAADLGWSSWGLQYNAAGHLPVADDWSSADATDPAYVDLANFYRTLYSEKLMPQEAAYPYADCAPFGEGQVAMSACGSWAIGQLTNDYADVIPNTAVAAFPSIDGDPSKPTATLGGWTLTVDGKSKVQQEGADFISWLLAGDTDHMVDFFKTSGFSKYPARISVAEALAADPEASANPFMQTVSEDIVPFAKAEPTYPWEIALSFATAIEKSMRGEDVQAALETANTEIDGIIEKQKLAGTAP
ncbi:extracellular solute-binding protein [Agromyces sp. NPDC056965]|uniref:extracellular solute-binding protein n=1 Tax=Agromyces sp. NPDC056965 TaxID=3345983 RepID=UPI003645859E